MDIKEIRNIIKTEKYNFLKEYPLGENIILLGLGGSYAYGINNENSDLDIRGIATNSRENILTYNDFEQVVDKETDTVIYSLQKMVKLLCSCNPNVIELLGLKKEHYLYLSPLGELLLENKKIFLSKRAINSFAGYANEQLRRLQNRVSCDVNYKEKEQYILDNIKSMIEKYKNYGNLLPKDSIKVYIELATNEEGIPNRNIFTDIEVKHCNFIDFNRMILELKNIFDSYDKIGKRNKYAINHAKIGKHMCHLIRLYFMLFDILEYGEINTFREKEHDLLMQIRNGDYLDENSQPITEFYKLLSSLNTRLEYLKLHTNLPEQIDISKVNKLLIEINETIM